MSDKTDGPQTPPSAENKTDKNPPRPLSKNGKIKSWIICLFILGFIFLLITYITHRNKASQKSGNTASQRHHNGRSGMGPPGSEGDNMPVTVGITQSKTADVPIVVEALGTVTPVFTITVKPQVSGVIQHILYKEGQLVHEGQPLAVIDPRLYAAQLTQSRGNLMRDIAQLENARIQLARDRQLGSDSIAKQDVDTQAALVHQLEGTVENDRGAVRYAEVNLGYTTIPSPVTGRVGLRPVDQGNYIASGDTNGVAVVTSLDPIDVVFTMAQDFVPAVERQIKMGRQLTGTAFDRTKTENLGEGWLLTLDNKIDTTSGTIKGKIRFHNGQGKLFPNQFVNIRLNVETLPHVVIVPSSAVRESDEGSYVWLVDNNKKVHRHFVTTGTSFKDNIVILRGLKENQNIVTEGGDRLIENSVVQTPADTSQKMGLSNRSNQNTKQSQAQH
ncbi:efflux RND transporter periplasmic adaptor subunit [Zymomonas mobilis]|uniref:Efflux transporter, RND family, MFP subunit n=1 Tax=Zymomonas mobilis subsp. pomaceae (strain ATCC 29192 / DSM 22645 / JCM 10191 / CCUG 17912 / NBRC 13757 / NCIMB 11200 / NRRL B-4491 / Barker I) TaxID=579138 RepID=F8EW50_ZYMMT|nr:efflux RND transporter periplasmic adaptor subunit [Zymomonas mobilis]AEI38460.1 efflux transporter, RND family, MFP subunit [Zymomonas mobilis subsp. pomaceae ATCC 29192]MDX5948149.1 efflux RND transporter periplasmic adaptor subunit [Zymomonas mobilis subsp. pomaceae]GEB89740.1 transport system membrane protein [Zymomonas mobilis subsp. pomaceae]